MSELTDAEKAEVADRLVRELRYERAAALVLAGHVPVIGTRAAMSRAVCDCGWRGVACEYPEHLARILADAAGADRRTTT